jgi:hypothetical protein
MHTLPLLASTKRSSFFAVSSVQRPNMLTMASRYALWKPACILRGAAAAAAAQVASAAITLSLSFAAAVRPLLAGLPPAPPACLPADNAPTKQARPWQVGNNHMLGCLRPDPQHVANKAAAGWYLQGSVLWVCK